MKPYHFHKDGTIPTIKPGMVWVFGSNYSGIHGKGAAKVAREKFGAINGKGEGLQGRSYAIPSCNLKKENGVWQTLPIPLIELRDNISWFLESVEKFDHKKYGFFITRIGCGLAGFKDSQVAPFFKGAKGNFSFAEEWRPYL